MAADPNGHIVILTAYEVIDDTVLTSKSVFLELLSKDADKQIENIMFSVNDLNARTTLLSLFQGRTKALFPPNLSSDLEILAEIDLICTTTSKKDPEIRRQELSKALSPYLLQAIAAAPADLVATSFGCQFVTEVLFGAEGNKSMALAAIAETAAGDPTYVQPPVTQDSADTVTAESAKVPSHIASTAHGGKMLKALIAGGRFDSKIKKIEPVVPALGFADILYPHIKEHIVEWATGSSSFVVLALLEASNFSQKDEVLQTLKKKKKALKKATEEEAVEQKTRREGSEVENDVKTGSKRKKSKSVNNKRETRNKGARLLLEKL
jgi:pumilio family protein 6